MPLIYSILEYKNLVDSAPPYSIINHINFMLVKGHAYNDPDCKDLTEFVKNDYPDTYRLIYETPLDTIPLLINHKIEVIKAIALWRLRIGR